MAVYFQGLPEWIARDCPPLLQVAAERGDCWKDESFATEYDYCTHIHILDWNRDEIGAVVVVAAADGGDDLASSVAEDDDETEACSPPYHLAFVDGDAEVLGATPPVAFPSSRMRPCHHPPPQ